MDIDALKTNIKRFLLNPNTLTFFLVIVLIVIVYIVYGYMIDKAVDPVAMPYATRLIKSNEEINNDDVLTIKVSGTFLSSVGDSIIQSRGRIIGYQVASGFQIPKYSFFFKNAVVEKNTEAGDDLKNMPDGYAMYKLKVDFHSTYENSIMPGNYIDLYFKTYIDTKLVYEPFITSIKVTSVVDKDHNNVFSNSDDEKEAKPAFLYFEVPEEIFKLLGICERLGNIEIEPIPRDAGYSENPAETEIANPAVEEYIKTREYEITY